MLSQKNDPVHRAVTQENSELKISLLTPMHDGENKHHNLANYPLNQSLASRLMAETVTDSKNSFNEDLSDDDDDCCHSNDRALYEAQELGLVVGASDQSHQPQRSSCGFSFSRFFKPQNYVIQYGVSLTSLIVLSYDFYLFGSFSTKRFGCEWYEVLFGTANHPGYLNSSLGSINPGSLMFWLPHTVITTLSLSERVYRGFKKTPEQLCKPIFTSQHNNARLEKFLFGLSIYGWLKFLSTSLLKSIQLIEHYQQKNTCDGKYVYLPNLVKYACTLCGDWDFIFPAYTSSPQECFNALLAHKSTGEVINELGRFNAAHNITSMDLSNHPGVFYNEELATGMFNGLKQFINGRLTTFTINTPNFNISAINPQALQHFPEFIIKANPQQLSLSGQYLGENFRLISPAFSNTTIETIKVTNNALIGAVGNHLLDHLPNTTTSISLASNAIDESIKLGLERNTPRLSIKTLDLSINTQLNNNNRAITQGLRDSQQPTNLDVSNNEMGISDAMEFGDAIAANKVGALNLENASVDNKKCIYIATGFNSNITHTIILSNNPDINGCIKSIDQLPPNLEVFEMKNSSLEEDGWIKLFELLKETKTQILMVDGAENFTPNVCAALGDLMRGRGIEILGISKCNLNNECIRRLGDHADNKFSLKKLYIGENKFDQEGQELIEDYFSNAEHISFAHTHQDVLSDYIAIKRTNKNSITSLDFSDTTYDISKKTNRLQLGLAVKQNNVKDMSLENTDSYDEQQNELNNNLLSNGPSLRDLDDSFLTEQTQMELKYSSPSTQLEAINIKANPKITVTSLQPFLHMLDAAKLEPNKIQFDSNGLTLNPQYKDAGYSGIGAVILSFGAFFIALMSLKKCCNRKKKSSSSPFGFFQNESKTPNTISVKHKIRQSSI